jgi:chorismate mutase/prephenate dehydratase
MSGSDRDAELARHRAAIDALDREVLARLNERARHAQAIGTLKSGGAAYRPEREAQVLARLQAANTGPLPNDAVAWIFREAMSACLALEQTLRVAYLGPAGTFSHEAVGKHFGQSVDMQPYATIDDVFRAAESGQTDHAVVPVENSTEGAVGRTLDLMFQTPLVICGEIRLRVRHYLLSAGATTAEIASVYSHPQSLAQCVQWLARHLPNAAPIPVASNAEAARLAATEPGNGRHCRGECRGDLRAQHSCAAHRGRPNNTTRFWVLGRNRVAPSGRDETSLVMSAPIARARCTACWNPSRNTASA